MAGLAEKGESVWLTEALVYALATWAEVAERRGDRRRAARYRREAARSRRAINRHAWDGAWYARGFTDAGKPFGVKTDTQGRIFLNAQSWAIICGAADVRRAASCIRSVERMLMAPAGAMKLWPPFSGMRKEIGKLTQKVPGWNENGSVYCHASTFYACALFVAREADKGFDALRRLLPGYGRNTIRRTGQVPLYLPNFYRGETAGRKAGLSSHAPNTGTASWYYRAVVAMLLGVRGEAKGLRIDPQLPKAWKRVTVWRRWRGAEFDIEIVRARGRGRPRVAVTLDGRAIRGNLIPAQAPKSRHAVRVLVR
jgi:cellobionic acid phosphorylase